MQTALYSRVATLPERLYEGLSQPTVPPLNDLTEPIFFRGMGNNFIAYPGFSFFFFFFFLGGGG